MNKEKIIVASLFILFLALQSCDRRAVEYDASGTFESTEVMVSAEANGQIKEFQLNEGDTKKAGEYLGYIDTTQFHLNKEQLYASQTALRARLPNVNVQLASTQEQLHKAHYEKKRLERLFVDGAATQKQVDDLDSQIKVLESSEKALSSNLSSTVKGIFADIATLEAQIAVLDNQIAHCHIRNPIDGTILAKYVEKSEFVTIGRPLYKIADTKRMYLRVYLVSSQLESLSVGSKVKIFVQNGEKLSEYKGALVWISAKAEFTPKTIQTKDERQNLVYAAKIGVENVDQLLKIGMYADVIFEK